MGLFLAFIVVIFVLLVIYFYARKKTAKNDDQHPSSQRPENELEPPDNEIEAVEKSVFEPLPLPYSIKPPRLPEFPKEFAKAYSKGQEIKKV